MMKNALSFLRDDRGAASLEFAAVFPLLAAILGAYLEMGWLMTKQMMLDRGLDVTMRQIRVASAGVVNHDTIKDAVCANAYIMIDCGTSLKIQLIPYDDATPADFNGADCYDREAEVNLASSFADSGGSRDELMFVRACVLVDFLMPGAGLGFYFTQETPSNGYALVSYSAFKNEPV
ncbi:MAG: TadE/TadG family type IV pilus assembly protein [Pseudomonadota bacterium]